MIIPVIDKYGNIKEYPFVPERTLVQSVECFHLIFLKLLETRLGRARYVVKGGFNLRAWFGSSRYSEDLDLDVVRTLPTVLADKVRKLLAAPAFRAMLQAQGLALLRSSKPKQTETTQRWKFEIQTTGKAPPLHTRVEFSHRGLRDEFVLEACRSEIVRPYGLLPPTANHYTARAAIRQKIGALAGRRKTQARDIWDLDHLLRSTGGDPRPLSVDLLKALPEAIHRASSLPFDVFKAQVVPFLEPEQQKVYGTPETWASIGRHVVERLSEFHR